MRVCNLCRSTDRKASQGQFVYPNPDKNDQRDYVLKRDFDICDSCVDALLSFIEGSWYSRLQVAPVEAPKEVPAE